MAIEINKTIQTWGAVIGALAAIGGAAMAVDGHYAKAEAVSQIALRLDQKILADRGDKVQERIWKLEDRYPDRKQAPPPVNEQWRILEHEQKDIDIELKKTLDKSQEKVK